MTTEFAPSNLKEDKGSPPGAPPVSHDTAKDEEISLLDLLIILAERKCIVLSFTLGFAILGIVVSLLLPVRYTATVTLLPPQQNSSIGSALASQLGSLGGIASLATGGLSLKNPNEMFVAMLKSGTVEDAMVQHFDLMREYRQHYLSDARKIFEKRTIVDGSGKDGLIHISIEDGDPRRAAELADGYVNQFRDLSQHLAITEAGQRALFFKQQLEEAKDNLANAEEALVETEKETGLIEVSSQARALIESAAALNAQIAAKEVQIQAMQTYATGQNAQLIQAQQELDSLRAQLAKLGGSQDLSNGGILVPKGQVPNASLKYVRKLRDVKYYETIFEILARQFEVAKLDEAKEGALIQVVDAAAPPDKRSFPRRGLIVLGVTAAGVVVGILAALVLASLQRFKDDSNVAAKLRLLGTALSFRRHGSARYDTN